MRGLFVKIPKLQMMYARQFVSQVWLRSVALLVHFCVGHCGRWQHDSGKTHNAQSVCRTPNNNNIKICMSIICHKCVCQSALHYAVTAVWKWCTPTQQTMIEKRQKFYLLKHHLKSKHQTEIRFYCFWTVYLSLFASSAFSHSLGDNSRQFGAHNYRAQAAAAAAFECPNLHTAIWSKTKQSKWASEQHIFQCVGVGAGVGNYYYWSAFCFSSRK